MLPYGLPHDVDWFMMPPPLQRRARRFNPGLMGPHPFLPEDQDLFEGPPHPGMMDPRLPGVMRHYGFDRFVGISPHDMRAGRAPFEFDDALGVHPQPGPFGIPFDLPGRGHRPTAQCGVPGYTLVKPLKTGGMSDAINLVRDDRRGKLFIEKRVRADGPRAKRTKAELNALQLIERGCNLNYLMSHLWGPHKLYCTFILEYCDAGSLQDMIVKYRKNGRHISEEFAWHSLLGIANGLAFLHFGIQDATKESRMVEDWDPISHLDLKPQNVFLSTKHQEGEYPRVVVGDFGCAVTMDDMYNGMEHPRQQMCGTPEWYPPEGLPQVVGARNTRYGPETDVWQMAGTIQTLCTLTDRPDRYRLATLSPCGRHYSEALNIVVSAGADPNWKQRYTSGKMVRVVTMRQRRTKRYT